jgi:surface antigen
MRWISILAAILICTACQPQPASIQAVAAPGQLQPQATSAAEPPADRLPCSSYTVSVNVGGEQRQATVEACPQADGSWRITQNTPGLPAQIYTVPPPASSPYSYGYPYPADYAYPDFGLYWAGAPWVFGLAPSIVVVQRFKHSHHHHFSRGLGHGFTRGFGHGFAAARGGGAHR